MVGRSILRVLVGLVAACFFVVLTAREAKAAPSAWCADGFEAMPSDVCYIDGRKAGASADGRRTLVIWLHGVIGKNTNWSQNHERMLARLAKATGIEVLFPKGVLGEQVYAWPGTADAQAKHEAELIEQWMTAKGQLESREVKPFDQTFVFGFSSGAYYASSLAMRGRVEGVDGYGVFCGGQPGGATAAADAHFAPAYVGVCANDPTGTANHGRAFAASLAGAGIQRMVNEQQVGHDLSATHFVGAIAYLRSRKSIPRA